LLSEAQANANRNRSKIRASDGKVVVVKQQANSGLFVPRILKGCDLIADTFANSIYIHGWRIPLVPQSYGYAVYRHSQ
jgi:hypothetical protein